MRNFISILLCMWNKKSSIAALLSQSELNKSEIEQIIILKQRENK